MILAGELAVHHRDSPVSPVPQDLAGLPAIPEKAQIAPDADLLVRHRQAVVTGGGRTGEHALPDAVDHRFLQRVPAEGEQQHTDAGPAVGRFRRRHESFNRGLGVAPDHAGGVSARLAGGDHRPVFVDGREDEPRRRHRKRLGKRVLDLDAVNDHVPARGG